MEQPYKEKNKAQIIRKDARGCFVESLNDAFDKGKAHLEFTAYDANKPAKQRRTNHVHIFIDIPEFLCLSQEAMSGMLHARARQLRSDKDPTPLYQCLGGTSAERLKQYGNERKDGKSLSRTAKLVYSDRKDDFYLFVAESGPGEANDKGLIVPKFGNNPENRVAVIMSWRAVNELLLMTKTHFEAWLAVKYASEAGLTRKNTHIAKQPSQQKTQKPKDTNPVPLPGDNGNPGIESSMEMF